jgi:hypothetical protein
MPSLLVSVFVIQLVIYIINTIGASTINDLVFLPLPSINFTCIPQSPILPAS